MNRLRMYWAMSGWWTGWDDALAWFQHRLTNRRCVMCTSRLPWRWWSDDGGGPVCSLGCFELKDMVDA